MAGQGKPTRERFAHRTGNNKKLFFSIMTLFLLPLASVVLLFHYCCHFFCVISFVSGVFCVFFCFLFAFVFGCSVVCLFVFPSFGAIFFFVRFTRVSICVCVFVKCFSSRVCGGLLI